MESSNTQYIFSNIITPNLDMLAGDWLDKKGINHDTREVFLNDHYNKKLFKSKTSNRNNIIYMVQIYVNKKENKLKPIVI